MLNITEQLEVLRDEALLTAEYGLQAPGVEVFEAILARIAGEDDTEPQLDMSLRDALNRRLAWNEDPSTVIVDCESVCRRLLTAVLRSFRDPEDTAKVVRIIADISSSAAHHLAALAVERTSKERAAQRREEDVQQKINEALDQQEALLQSYSHHLHTR